VELWQKFGLGWNDWTKLQTVDAREALITDKLSICKKHTRLTITIVPKEEFECFPDCKSIYTDYNPVEQIERTTTTTFCFKNSTTGLIHFNVNRWLRKCVKNVELEVYQDNDTETRIAQVALSVIEVKIENPMRPYYVLIKTNGYETAVISVAKLYPSFEKNCPKTEALAINSGGTFRGLYVLTVVFCLGSIAFL